MFPNSKKKAFVTAVLIASATGAFTVFWSLVPRVERQDVQLHAHVQTLWEQNFASMGGHLSEYDNLKMTTSSKPWDLFHGLLGRLSDYDIETVDGQRQSCSDWLLRTATWQSHSDRVPLIVLRKEGYFFTHGPILPPTMEYEDHAGQFLYILSECGYDLYNTTFNAPPKGTARPLKDILDAELKWLHGLTDVSWLLPVILEWSENSSWVNKFHISMNFDSLFLQHLTRREHCKTCFGTHWHMGLALGLEYAGKKVSPEIRSKARKLLGEAVDRAHAALDESGQFKLDWTDYLSKVSPSDYSNTSSESDSRHLDALLLHQGHMLEWLMIALSDEEIAGEEWPHLAVRCLLEQLSDREEGIHYGIHSHCAHALRIYERRMQDLLPSH